MVGGGRGWSGDDKGRVSEGYVQGETEKRGCDSAALLAGLFREEGRFARCTDYPTWEGREYSRDIV